MKDAKNKVVSSANRDTIQFQLAGKLQNLRKTASKVLQSDPDLSQYTIQDLDRMQCEWAGTQDSFKGNKVQGF